MILGTFSNSDNVKRLKALLPGVGLETICTEQTPQQKLEAIYKKAKQALGHGWRQKIKKLLGFGWGKVPVSKIDVLIKIAVDKLLLAISDFIKLFIVLLVEQSKIRISVRTAFFIDLAALSPPLEYYPQIQTTCAPNV